MPPWKKAVHFLKFRIGEDGRALSLWRCVPPIDASLE
jgi:hypothetical protein